MTAERGIFNHHAKRGGLRDSRGNEGKISAGATARARRVFQRRFNGGAIISIETALSYDGISASVTTR